MKNDKSTAADRDDLQKRRYQAGFEPQSNCLYCKKLDLRPNEEAFHTDEAYHVEDNAHPGENAAVFAFAFPAGGRIAISHKKYG